MKRTILWRRLWVYLSAAVAMAAFMVASSALMDETDPPALLAFLDFAQQPIVALAFYLAAIGLGKLWHFLAALLVLVLSVGGGLCLIVESWKPSGRYLIARAFAVVVATAIAVMVISTIAAT